MAEHFRVGLLGQSAHKGVAVFRPTLYDLQETYEIRIALKVLATRIAVPRLTDEQIGALPLTVEAKRHTSYIDVDRSLALNAQFHMDLCAAAYRQRLVGLNVNYRRTSASGQRLSAAQQQDPRGTQDEHDAIFAACAASNAIAGREAMRQHLTTTVDVLTAALASSTTADATARA